MKTIFQEIHEEVNETNKEREGMTNNINQNEYNKSKRIQSETNWIKEMVNEIPKVPLITTKELTKIDINHDEHDSPEEILKEEDEQRILNIREHS